MNELFIMKNKISFHWARFHDSVKILTEVLISRWKFYNSMSIFNSTNLYI